ncbi:long-chain-fatty-acid--CoA ligase [Alteromonas lipolytica]|uniref:Long-chain fatty acid--CoA ligase n=1 Tax=Alteromonas lipolytica TaxID=1856405 RepID=A0A1E8FC23_9ALTE|nr:long-chain-fatty-acid--CoA ligase [Alteromonas lipolytica]OFI33474.1 hypothetical protein BFC17_04230 [Alteromonas lipolytica]GGF59372.1 long-chain-fatty-acid--CoA ligase [Alteromonas lipolytica]
MFEKNFNVWPTGKPYELPLPQTTHYQNFQRSLEQHPSGYAIIFYDTTITYAEMEQDVRHLAGWLQQQGVKRGDRVGVYTQNSPQFVMAYYAALRVGAVVVPINPMLVEEELEYIVDNADIKVVFAAVDLHHAFVGVMDRRDIKVVGVKYSDYLKVETSLPIPDSIAVQPHPDNLTSHAHFTFWQDVIAAGLDAAVVETAMDDMVLLPYTSGSTGHPKGCVHTNVSVQHAISALREWFDYTHGDTVLAIAPMFHVVGMQLGMNVTLASGGTMVILPRWDREVAAHAIHNYKVTVWPTVPTMVIDLMNMPDLNDYDTSSLRLMLGGGSSMPEAVAAKLKAQWGITFLEGYGLTETCCPATTNPPQAPKPQCGGIAHFNTLIQIVDPVTFTPVATGELGEIVVHGPQVMQGYWQDDEANKTAFIMLEGKRYFRTGDLGITDENGYFFIVDRLKRMINASGYKVWPTQVEGILYRHPAIAEACVIASKDPKRGETVKALIVAAEQYKDVTADDIILWSREHMAAYKIPRCIEFVDSLPKSGSNKVLWRQLQEAENQRTG